jgi:hypothetical protein
MGTRVVGRFCLMIEAQRDAHAEPFRYSDRQLGVP